MKSFLFIFRGGLDYATVSPEGLQQNMLQWKTWMDGLAQKGHLAGGERLETTGTQVKGKNKQVVDGPYAEGKEVVGGYLVIKATDLAEAVELAKGCPIYQHEGQTEVREIVVM